MSPGARRPDRLASLPCMESGVAIGLLALVVAIALPLVLEWLRKPRLEVKAERWNPSGPAPWSFAVVHVRNKPLAPWVPLARMTAEACRATIEFRKGEERDLAIPEIDARWSARPEPIKRDLVDPPADVADDAPAGAKLVIEQYDPEAVPSTLILDLPASNRWEEIAIAIIHQDGDAYGFGARSYAHQLWRNPAWKLDRGVYSVTVHIEASSVSKTETFKLDNLKADFARFRTSAKS